MLNLLSAFVLLTRREKVARLFLPGDVFLLLGIGAAVLDAVKKKVDFSNWTESSNDSSINWSLNQSTKNQSTNLKRTFP